MSKLWGHFIACISGSTTRSIKSKTSLSGALVLSALWGSALNKKEQFYKFTWESGDGDVIPELICNVRQLGFHPGICFCLQKIGIILFSSASFKRKMHRHIVIHPWALLHLNLGGISLCLWRRYFVASLVRCMQCFICEVHIIFRWDPIIFPWNLLNPQLLRWQKIGLSKPTVTDVTESTYIFRVHQCCKDLPVVMKGMCAGSVSQRNTVCAILLKSLSFVPSVPTGVIRNAQSLHSCRYIIWKCGPLFAFLLFCSVSPSL